MKTIIIGGFLGSGKTTIIMQLAKFLVGSGKRPHSVAILENEIGEIGVDDMLLRSEGYTVSELFNGCACCTMAGELRGNVRRLQHDLDPEWLILEATGVAVPQNIKDTLDPILEQPSIICCLADANRLMRMLKPAKTLIESQLTKADFIFLNKIDQVDDEMRARVQGAIREFNASAPVFEICGLKEVDPALWQQLLNAFA